MTYRELMEQIQSLPENQKDHQIESWNGYDDHPVLMGRDFLFREVSEEYATITRKGLVLYDKV